MATATISHPHLAHSENPVLCPHCKTFNRDFLLGTEAGSMCIDCTFPTIVNWTEIIRGLDSPKFCPGCNKRRRLFDETRGVCLKCVSDASIEPNFWVG
jgi:hypothetical protein